MPPLRLGTGWNAMKSIARLCLLTASPCIWAAPASPLFIDSFDDTGFGADVTIDLRPSQSVLLTKMASGVVGGERDLWATHTSGSDRYLIQLDNATLTVTESGGAQGELRLQWDGVDADASRLAFNLGGVDLTDGGAADSIEVGVLASDAAHLLTFAVYTVNSPLFIDSFDDTGFGADVTIDLRPSQSVLLTKMASGVVGGERDLWATHTSAGSGRYLIQLDNAALTVTESGGAQGELRLQWDGVDADPSRLAFNLGGVDLTDGGAADSIEVGVLASDAAHRLTFAIYSGNGSTSSTAMQLVGTVVGSPASLRLPFASFVGTADPSSVDAIELAMSSPDPNASLSLDFSRTAGIASSMAELTVGGGIASPASFFLPFENLVGTASLSSVDAIELTILSPNANGNLSLDFFRTAAASVCGDGTVEAGETCDDGGAGAADGCDATCQVEAGFSCVGEPSVCTREPGCPLTPSSCIEGASKARLTLKDSGDDGPTSSDRVIFKWLRGPAPSQADFADPTDGGDHHVCLYEDTGGGPKLLMQMTAPAPANWETMRNGFRYKDLQLSSDGVRTLIETGGPNAPSKIVLSGMGAGLPLPTMPRPLEAVEWQVQVHSDDAGSACYGARFDAGTDVRAATDRPGRLQLLRLRQDN